MTDRRLTPANGRVAASRLRGLVEAETFRDGSGASIMRPVADLWSSPDRATRDRQLLRGEGVVVYERRAGMAFVEAEKDGYVGYVDEAALGDPVRPTHAVAAPATHLYPAPDFKRPAVARLSFGARLRVVATPDARFAEAEDGLFVPRAHLRPVDRPLCDPAGVARLFLGVPYLWGGNSSDGIDCSGLVQAALVACGIACPGDSDLQETAVGSRVVLDAPVLRGDLFFWAGHVAMALDATDLIHANAHHMAVTVEPVPSTIARIADQGGGEVTTRRRVSPPRG
ncbi:NLP/P60 hydrolase [Palleronia sediminis]|uniref:NLP/P60 hydrolase n=1 Tax=Palleronia sediminis TaxID=2547833 RepID=A0A4R6A486_9RHOB|nr:NlpC/P60 family protein [Palleronia sediminis]TDL78410.1 NLP/P60 hydrolase [Palleronia sediminis]